jgi:hypothetical protein
MCPFSQAFASITGEWESIVKMTPKKEITWQQILDRIPLSFPASLSE